MVANTRRVPVDKRKRTETSCDKCKSRKQKCDKLLNKAQCRYCEVHAFECTITQPRKKRSYASMENFERRQALLESLVKGLLPEADLSCNDEMLELGRSLGIPLPMLEVAEESTTTTISKQDDEATLPLVPDQQGQVQYIGPASSFSFHVKLRKLIGDYTSLEFAMFGRNAAEQVETYEESSSPNTGSGKTTETNTLEDCDSPMHTAREIDRKTFNVLLDAYFDTIHPDFPVLGLEASFRAEYESWLGNPSAVDPAWLCGLYCIFLLSYRLAPVAISDEIEKKWWRQAQRLIPAVLFASNIHAIRALMLAALHLHNTEHRDACWNLTGTAIRIAFAIGLHRDDVKHLQTPLSRELRRQLWWTLYAFEQMQVSSYDRPSAIGDAVNCVSCPNERIVGIAGSCPQDFTKSCQRLMVLLGSACKALNLSRTGNSPVEDIYSRPLSPTAGILRDLNRWKEALPPHLHIETSTSLAPSSQRSVVLLHAQWNYIAVLLSRSAMLQRATILSKTNHESVPKALAIPCQTCVDSGKTLGRLVLRLDAINKFNALTWWDMFYTITSAMVLVLDVHWCTKMVEYGPATESQDLLQKLAALAAKHLQNPRMPGSMKKWALLVVEIGSITETLTQTLQTQSDDAVDMHALGNLHIPSSADDHGTYFDRHVTPVSDNKAPHMLDINETTAPGGTTHVESCSPNIWSKFPYIDESAWPWDDLETILRGDLWP